MERDITVALNSARNKAKWFRDSSDELYFLAFEIVMSTLSIGHTQIKHPWLLCVKPV